MIKNNTQILELTPAAKRTLVGMVERLTAAGMNEDRALKEVSYGYHVEIKTLRDIYRGGESE